MVYLLIWHLLERITEVYKLPTEKFLADGSVVTCKEMGVIDVPIQNNKNILGTLRLDNVLIAPSLDRRLFFVSSFLQNGNNWVHFENNSIHLGIKDGSKVRIPKISL